MEREQERDQVARQEAMLAAERERERERES
jgi:hypothetical protein